MEHGRGELRIDDGDHDRLAGSGAIGRPYTDRVVDDAGKAVPRGEEGELVLRGPGLMDGYFRDADATARILRDGWLHTGDVVTQDAEGVIYFVGRTKDMIRRSSENVAAAEVERVYFKIPRYWSAIGSLPMTLSERVAKGQLVRPSRPGFSGDGVAPALDGAATIGMAAHVWSC